MLHVHETIIDWVDRRNGRPIWWGNKMKTFFSQAANLNVSYSNAQFFCVGACGGRVYIVLRERYDNNHARRTVQSVYFFLFSSKTTIIKHVF